jgi:hypothetical protein
MKMIFGFTHGVMLICIISIIYYSVFYTGEKQIEFKFTIISRLILKIKSTRVNRIFLYRLASNLIFIFFR